MPQKSTTPNNPPQAMYLLTGEDEFRKKLLLERLKTATLGKAIDAFNYELHDAKTSSIEDIINSLQTLPATDGKKLIVLREAELLSEDDKSRLTACLGGLHSKRIVFVLSTEKPIPKYDKLYSEVSKRAKVIDFSRLRPEEVSLWITKEFNLRKKNINRRTADLICEALGQDMGQISLLMEQLSIFTGEKEKITDEDALRFIDTPTLTSALDLLDFINQKNTSRSLCILKGLLRSGSNPSQIIGLLNWHMTRLISVKRMLIKKIPADRMLPQIKATTYTLNKLISQAGNFTLKQLKGQLNALLDADIMLKTSNVKGEFLLEILVTRMASA